MKSLVSRTKLPRLSFGANPFLKFPQWFCSETKKTKSEYMDEAKELEEKTISTSLKYALYDSISKEIEYSSRFNGYFIRKELNSDLRVCECRGYTFANNPNNLLINDTSGYFSFNGPSYGSEEIDYVIYKSENKIFELNDIEVSQYCSIEKCQNAIKALTVDVSIDLNYWVTLAPNPVEILPTKKNEWVQQNVEFMLPNENNEALLNGYNFIKLSFIENYGSNSDNSKYMLEGHIKFNGLTQHTLNQQKLQLSVIQTGIDINNNGWIIYKTNKPIWGLSKVTIISLDGNNDLKSIRVETYDEINKRFENQFLPETIRINKPTKNSKSTQIATLSLNKNMEEETKLKSFNIVKVTFVEADPQKNNYPKFFNTGYIEFEGLV